MLRSSYHPTDPAQCRKECFLCGAFKPVSTLVEVNMIRYTPVWRLITLQVCEQCEATWHNEEFTVTLFPGNTKALTMDLVESIRNLADDVNDCYKRES